MHLSLGSVPVVLSAEGEASAVEAAYRSASDVLDARWRSLGEEADAIQDGKAQSSSSVFGGSVLGWPGDPMLPLACALTGALADNLLSAMRDAGALDKASVTVGLDTAFHLAGGHVMDFTLMTEVERKLTGGRLKIGAESPVRGISTRGRGAKPLVQGVADAVTVLAESAASASYGASLISEAVDVDHGAISRASARSVDHESALGDRPVVTAFGEMPFVMIARAIDAGAVRAERYRSAGRIQDAILYLRGESRIVGPMPYLAPPALTFD